MIFFVCRETAANEKHPLRRLKIIVANFTSILTEG